MRAYNVYMYIHYYPNIYIYKCLFLIYIHVYTNAYMCAYIYNHTYIPVNIETASSIQIHKVWSYVCLHVPEKNMFRVAPFPCHRSLCLPSSKNYYRPMFASLSSCSWATYHVFCRIDQSLCLKTQTLNRHGCRLNH